jgi:hypothetical protein
MNVLAFRFVLVTLQALGSVGVLVQRHGMNRRESTRGHQRQQHHPNPCGDTMRASAAITCRLAEPDAMRDQIHADSDEIL